MKVKFVSNLGSRDAKELGLDHLKCLKDHVVDVPKDVAEKLANFRRPGRTGVLVLANETDEPVTPEPKPVVAESHAPAHETHEPKPFNKK